MLAKYAYEWSRHCGIPKYKENPKKIAKGVIKSISTDKEFNAKTDEIRAVKAEFDAYSDEQRRDKI